MVGAVKAAATSTVGKPDKRAKRKGHYLDGKLSVVAPDVVDTFGVDHLVA